ncbi:MAG: OmpA family protein [Thiomicrorhabdus sp.]|nr:OmpA family protein [Thiomicrorhabdus sp.]
MSSEKKQKNILFWFLLILMILVLIFVIKDCSNDSVETGLPSADEAINESKDIAKNSLDALNKQAENTAEFVAGGGESTVDNVVDTANSAVKSITGVEQEAVLNAVNKAVASSALLSGNDANEVVSGSVPASIKLDLTIPEGVLQGNIVHLLSEDKLVPGNAYHAGTLHYRADKSMMSLKEKAIMDAVFQIANAYPDIRISLHGHTDTSGSGDANQKLSAKRASNAKEWLVKSGVSAQRISVYGHGSSQPMVSNATFEGRVKNRRTEIFIQK